MILNDKEIIRLARNKELLNPFIDHKVKGALSYGLEPFGYTIQLLDEFRYFLDNKVIDPLNIKDTQLSEIMKSNNYLLKPGNIVLGRSIEYIKMPKDITGIALTKSTYSRLGIFANISSIDAGWEGFLTIEIANLGQNPVYIIANKGIAQIHFMNGDLPISTYLGKYHKLKGIEI